MRLYNFPWGPYPRRLALYLHEKKLEIEVLGVEFPHRPELWPAGFLKSLNPAASLPVLELESGQTLGQSLTILEYLEERYPERSLVGSTAEARARTRELTSVFDEATTFFGIWARQGSQLNARASDANTLGSARHAPSLEAARIARERFFAKLQIAEDLTTDSRMLLGDGPSLADVVGAALLEFTGGFYGVPIPTSCPKLSRWHQAYIAGAPKCAFPQDLLAVAFGLPEQTG